MQRFFLRHLSVIFSLCLITTSSYVLFDLLDIDGSNLKEHSQVCGFEAVLPPCGGEIKPAATNNPTPWPAIPRGVSLSELRCATHAFLPVARSVSSCPSTHIRKVPRREPTSSARGSDPARRSA